jgi:hypothetical protein
MQNKTLIQLMLCLVMLNLGCTKENSPTEDLTQTENVAALRASAGSTQFDGIGYFDAADECGAAAAGAAYAVTMTGDLEGCLFVFIDEYECSPSGTYREIGREHFVGTYNGEAGTFWTSYKFEAKYEGCAENGSYVGAEIFGRCQHPIVAGSGTGIFEGVSGRMDMKDNVTEGSYPYRGHFRY